MSESLRSDRPKFSNAIELRKAADLYVEMIGSKNARWMLRNITHTTDDSDALRELRAALIQDARRAAKE